MPHQKTPAPGSHVTPAAVSARVSDEALMQRIQRDDRDAFNVLHDRLMLQALVVAGQVCVDAERARDAVQEAFVSLWRARGTYRPERGNVHSWAFQIVRNRAIDCSRRDNRHDRWRGGDETRAEALPANGDPESAMVADERARHLRTLLADLPESQREVVALAYFGELTHLEIAERLGLPLGTVKGRMRLGLQRLRRGLEAQVDEPY